MLKLAGSLLNSLLTLVIHLACFTTFFHFANIGTFVSYLILPTLALTSKNYNYITEIAVPTDNAGADQGKFPPRTPRLQNDPKDCQWAPFGPWTKCSLPCGAGIQRRHRTVAIKAEPGGKACRIEAASEIRLCNRQPCGAGLDN